MAHAHRLVSLGGEKRGVERHVADIAARHLQARQLDIVQTFRRRLRRENPPPDFGALSCVGKWKLDDEAQAAQERRVQGTFHIGCKDRQAAVRLHTLEQITDLNIGVTVVAVFDLATLAEERVGFIEQQNRSAFFGGVEDPAQVFFGLANVLAHHLAEIDAIEERIKKGDCRVAIETLFYAAQNAEMDGRDEIIEKDITKALKISIEQADREKLTKLKDNQLLILYSMLYEDELTLTDAYKNYVEIIKLSQNELVGLSGFKDLNEAITNYLSKFNNIFIITLGKNGARIYKKNEINKTVRGIDLCPFVDATGCGDIFFAGFIYGLSKEYQLEECVLFGNICAGLSVSSKGVDSIPKKEDIIKMYNSLK